MSKKTKLLPKKEKSSVNQRLTGRVADERNRRDTLLIPVRVQSRSSRPGILGVVDGRLRIRTTAPPVDGQANTDVARQLAAAFHVSPSNITLKNGQSGRNKTFVVERATFLPDWLDHIAFR